MEKILTEIDYEGTLYNVYVSYINKEMGYAEILVSAIVNNGSCESFILHSDVIYGHGKYGVISTLSHTSNYILSFHNTYIDIIKKAMQVLADKYNEDSSHEDVEAMEAIEDEKEECCS